MLRDAKAAEYGLKAITGDFENVFSFRKLAQAESSAIVRRGTVDLCIRIRFADFNERTRYSGV